MNPLNMLARSGWKNVIAAPEVVDLPRADDRGFAAAFQIGFAPPQIRPEIFVLEPKESAATAA